jgi:hypothetical protein
MVDIPEKMIDNSRHIIKYALLQLSKKSHQLERKAVEAKNIILVLQTKE